MEGKTCEACIYFQPTARDKDDRFGLCRKDPPVVILAPDSTGRQFSYWPEVNFTDWCGQFLSRGNLYEKKKKK